MNQKKCSEQLGMNYSTATSRLKKNILFNLLVTYDLNICFHCQKRIELVEELSVEHKVPWLDNSSELFWDLENIGFSHLSCNCRAGKKPSLDELTKLLNDNRPEHRTNAPKGQSWCCSCKQYLILDLFSKHKSKINGVQSTCQKCRSLQRKVKKF